MMKAEDLKQLSDKELSKLLAMARKESEQRFRAKKNLVMFEGKPLPKQQAIQAFLDNKAERQKAIDKVLDCLPNDAKQYMVTMGELHQYAMRTKKTDEAQKLVDVMKVKVSEYVSGDKVDAVVKRFFV